MKVRAKFTVTDVQEEQGGKKVALNAVYDETLPEDQRFSEATPSGTVEMFINNPPAAEFFQTGKSYYLDFTPVEEPQPDAA